MIHLPPSPPRAWGTTFTSFVAEPAEEAALSTAQIAAWAVLPVAPKAFLLAHLEAQPPHLVAGLQGGAGLQIPKFPPHRKFLVPSCPQGPCQ